MRISHTIDLNALTAYDTSPSVFTRRGKLKCDEFSWDSYSVQSLRELCIIAISNNWENRPLYNELEILADRTLLEDILPCNLPLELTIPIIESDSYWQRCFFDRWPGTCPPNRYLTHRNTKTESENGSLDGEDTNDIVTIDNDDEILQSNSVHSSNISHPLLQYIRSKSRVNDYANGNVIVRKTWKQCFVERYVQEELEEMSPDMFNPEYIKELTDLCGPYLISLHLRQLKHTAANTDHISLHSLLARLLNLIEFSICFSQANLGDNFSWQAMKISDIDCELLGNGVEKSNIEILRVLRSFIDCNKLKLIIKPLTTHKYLQVLDFSHCKIRDEGALALVELLKENVNIKHLILVNNKIGPTGAEGFGCYLRQEESTLVELNLKLNPIKSAGGNAIVTALGEGAKSLRILSLSACGLTSDNIHIANALSSNTTLQKLDLSNNHLGENVGVCLLNQLDTITTLLDIDVRMCGFAPDVVYKIQTKVKDNTKQSKGLLETPEQSGI